MSYNNYIFSKFAHTYNKDGICAHYNALRLRPVYISQNTSESLEKVISGKIAINSLPIEQQSIVNNAISELVKNKILVPNSGYDETVLNKYRALANKPSIKIAYFIMTDKCNFNCSYCFIQKEQQKSKKPFIGNMSKKTALASLDLYLNFIDDGETDDDKIIIFYGGEPLINFETIKTVVDKVFKLRESGELTTKFEMAVITNGSLLNDQNIQYLKEHNVGIGISVDGDELVTNSNRKYNDGSSTYHDIMDGINLCKKHKCDDFSLSVTISEECLNNFDSTMSFIEKNVNSKNIGFNILMNTGENIENDEYAVKASEFLIKAFKRFRENGIYEDRMMRKVKAFVDGKVHLFDCAATGANQFVIAPDGQIGICHGFLGTKTFFSDNVFNQSFSPEKNEDFCEWAKRTPVNIPECLECEAIGICGGGCPFNSYQASKNIWELDRRFCTHTKTTMKWLIWDLYDQAQKGS